LPAEQQILYVFCRAAQNYTKPLLAGSVTQIRCPPAVVCANQEPWRSRPEEIASDTPNQVLTLPCIKIRGYGDNSGQKMHHPFSGIPGVIYTAAGKDFHPAGSSDYC
jgi:hypothetical protein